MAYLFVHNRVAHSWVHLCVCVWPTETDHKMAAIKQSAQQLQLSTRCRRRKWLSLTMLLVGINLLYIVFSRRGN